MYSPWEYDFMSRRITTLYIYSRVRTRVSTTSGAVQFLSAPESSTMPS